MKLSSLFKHKAYAFNQPSDTEQDCRFAQQLIKKVKPKFNIISYFVCTIERHGDRPLAHFSGEG